MNIGNIAFLVETAGFHVHENRGHYDADTDTHDAATDHAKPLHEAQHLVGDVLNLAGLLLAALEDQGDARAMQVSTAVTVIEDKLKAAYNRLDEHEARHVTLIPEPGPGHKAEGGELS